jgi:hypothetical protein
MGGEPAIGFAGIEAGDFSRAETNCSLVYRLRNRRQHLGSMGIACTATIGEILTNAP